MLIKESALNKYNRSSFEILNKLTYLTEDEASFKPQTVPIISMDEGAQVVEYDYLKQMMLEAGVDLDQAKAILAEVNGIDSSTIVTVIPEYEVILNPSLMESAGQCVLTPISPDSDAYFFCETMVQLYEETMDESYLSILLEDEKQDFIRKLALELRAGKITRAEQQAAIASWERKERADQEYQQRKKEEKIKNAKERWEAEKERTEEVKRKKKELEEAIKQRKKDHADAKAQSDADLEERRNMSFPRKVIHKIATKWNRQSDFTKSVLKTAATAAGAVGAGGLAMNINNRLQRIRAEAANQPHTWLAKKVAALRSIYLNYLNRARVERAQGRAGIFKKIASKILGVIDFLMRKLQHAVN